MCIRDRNMILRLNDIVRGEYRIPVNYKRTEVITDSSTHENRLKVLYTWLSKHMHRIVDYSDEYYSQVVRVLDGYLLAPDNYDIFNDYYELHKDVWSRYSQIQQARKVRILEDLRYRKYKGEPISYHRMLILMTEILGELKFEIVNYFDKLVVKVLIIGDDVTSDPYLLRKYIDVKEDSLSPYGKDIRKSYQKLVALLDEFRSIRKSRTSGVFNPGMLRQHYSIRRKIWNLQPQLRSPSGIVKMAQKWLPLPDLTCRFSTRGSSSSTNIPVPRSVFSIFAIWANSNSPALEQEMP
eukprot:TRINITY_DN30275_c0_g1_i1.p1 TRINITY_DN30275_c0_g1~~TRINITY_DN30275_c0_g1_i1.p1  ORF type:complete len:295 (+),score=18.32 TRINITY_DN30275_c0_g1_i1:156-1040(+)